jgi:hypothetical protein
MTTKVDQNYPSAGYLIAVDKDTLVPVPDVTIQIYEASKYPPSSNVRDTWVGKTLSDVDGNWLDPIYLDDGVDWVVKFSKNLTYDTKTVEIST